MLNLALLKNFFGSRSKDFWRFEASVWFHVFASGIISIFLPILLYDQGFSLKEILLFYLFFHTANVPLNFLAEKLLRTFGAKAVVILATFINILFYLLLSSVGVLDGMKLLLIIAVLGALYDALYYVSSLYLFVDSNEKIENTGKNTNIFNIITGSSSFLGPLVGSGLLIFSNNENILFYTATLFFLLSVLPLLVIKNLKDKPLSPKMTFREFFKDKKEKINHLILFFYKVATFSEYWLWPLFIYTLYKSFESVAAVAVLTPVAGLLFLVSSGGIKRDNRFLIIALGAFFAVLLWTGRLYFENTSFYFASVALMSFFILLVQVPLDSNLYFRAKLVGNLTGSVYKNVVSMFAKALFILILLLFPEEKIFEISFIIAIISLATVFLLSLYAKKVYKQSIKQSAEKF